MTDVDQHTRHSLEEHAISLEKAASHFSDGGYPWYNRKVAGAYRRAATILRTVLKEGAAT